MIQILQKEASLTDTVSDVIIVLAEGKHLHLPPGSTSLKKYITASMARMNYKGQRGELIQINPASTPVIISGCGSDGSFYARNIEQATAAAIRFGLRQGYQDFIIAGYTSSSEAKQKQWTRLISRGAILGSYTFDLCKSVSADKKRRTLRIATPKLDKHALKQAKLESDVLCKVLDLANLPGNLATPSTIHQWTQKEAKACGLAYEAWRAPKLKREGCGGILSVAKGSSEEPAMIFLKHNVEQTNKKPIVLIGKTVTFDAGGISLKPSKDMGWMRYDKCGGMAVLATMLMMARLKINQPVIGILGVAENMPGPDAMRPGDIIKSHSGKFIEVLNTDAEGRLILADAISIAHQFNPSMIIDVATLTGAVITALGHEIAAVLGNDETLISALDKAGKQSGERIWQLPLLPIYRKDMNSDFADIANLSKSGTAGTATAAAFLHEFIEDDIPWAHLDIAGTAWQMSTKPHQDAGATLFGARLLLEWVLTLDKDQ